jgi:AcrR family transcriptional regulator
MARAVTRKTKATTGGAVSGAKSSDARPVRRAASPGRPARLSREMILAKSVELLVEHSIEGFTLARVADALDTVSMALYNYFPSREALLNAVADHICKQFRMPKAKPGQSWQDKLRAWLWAVKKHAEKNPVIFKVMGVDGRTSAGWLSITYTVGKTLHEQGLRDRELAAAVWLFCSQAIGLLLSEYGQGSFRTSLSLSHLEQLGPEQQAFFLQLRNYHVPLTAEELLEEGFNDLIANLERKIALLGKK